MNSLDLDVRAARERIANLRTQIVADPNAASAKQNAQRLARSFFGDSPLATEAGKLPVDQMIPNRPAHFGVSQVPRTAAFDAALNAFFERIDVALAQVEDYQRRRTANSQISRSEIRSSVLAFFAHRETELAPGSVQWGQDALFVLGLSEHQLRDALEHMEQIGAIESGKYRPSSGGEWSWMILLTPHGRDLADGTATISTHLATTIIYQTFHAPVANAGTVHGDVVQNIAGFPTMPQELRDALLASPAGVALVDQLEEELATSNPRPEKLERTVRGIVDVMKATNTAVDFTGHASDWLSAAGSWIGELAGHIVDFIP